AVQRLAPAEIARGVDVRFIADTVTIDLWVIMEHHLRVVEVAHNVMVIVKYAVEQALGLPVAQVNVNIQALRVRE
ncbi:MAG: Asp23/Gls24 family envelope stress response protein, partial [Chloroflexota bacterium]|nr:Asp23/Gls24 family envelope stress response protein [Chloroflexota bacterium]